MLGNLPRRKRLRIHPQRFFARIICLHISWHYALPLFPSNAAWLLKENLMEEMGRSEKEKPHSALLVELVRGIGFPENEVDQLITDARKRVAIFCATRVPVATCASFAYLSSLKP